MKVELKPIPSPPPAEVTITMTVQEAKILRDLVGAIAGTSSFVSTLYSALRYTIGVRNGPALVRFQYYPPLSPYLEDIPQ